MVAWFGRREVQEQQDDRTGRKTGGADQQDPVLYRFYEALMVYGQSYKSIIHEKVSGPLPSQHQRVSAQRCRQ